jgi:hypothetical protein
VRLGIARGFGDAQMRGDVVPGEGGEQLGEERLVGADTSVRLHVFLRVVLQERLVRGREPGEVVLPAPHFVGGIHRVPSHRAHDLQKRRTLQRVLPRLRRGDARGLGGIARG